MKLTGEVIGEPEQIEMDMEKFIRNAERLPGVLDQSAEKIVNQSKNLARMKGLSKTGAGLAGIIYEREGDDRLIGWAPRPNLHLFFHEIGTYKDYPRPHVRPAADQKENEIMKDIQKTIEGN